MIKKILQSEKFFIIAIAALAMLFNALPYAYQRQIAPTDKVYIGSFPILYDKPTYLAEMTQGEAGNWKMIDMYTTEPQQPVFIYPLYLGLGHIARITQISVENIFLISRFFFGIILLFAVLYFIRYFTPEENQRKIAYTLALFASGLGWLNINQQSIDLWIPDAIPMIRFSYFPHIMLANTLFLASILLIYHAIKNNSAKVAIASGIATFALNIILPFESAFLYILIASFAIIYFFINQNVIKNNLKNLLLFFIISIPSFVFMIYLGTTNPIWKMVEKQNILITPPFFDIFTGYGIILFFSILGLWTLIKKDKLKGILFSLWILGVFILTRIPLSIYPMQRRFLETAFYIPLAITAGFGMAAIYDYLKQKRIKNLNHKIFCFSMFFLIPAFFAGNLQVWYNRFDLFIKNTENPLFYLPKENIEAMKWLSQNTPTSSIILASFYNSNVIPYYADRIVYAGHGAMTVNFKEKLAKTEKFYSGKYSSGEMIEFFKKEKIDYIFYSEEEKISAISEKRLNYFNPNDYPFFKKIYQNEKVKIYKVR